MQEAALVVAHVELVVMVGRLLWAPGQRRWRARGGRGGQQGSLECDMESDRRRGAVTI